MKKLLIAALAGLALGGLPGCSTTPITATASRYVPAERIIKAFPDGEGKVQVTFLRDAGLFGSGCDYDIKINEELAFVMKEGERAEVFLLPGTHTFTASYQSFLCLQALASRTTELKPGKPEEYRLMPAYGNIGMSRTK